MSRILGEIRQLGFVVNDIEAAMAQWTKTIGVGPFFYFKNAPIENFIYKGKPSPVELSAALAYSGNLQIELIHQTNDAPSIYLDFLKNGHQGLHHFAYWMEDATKYLESYHDDGFELVQSGTAGGEGYFYYLENEKHPGIIIELSEVKGGKADFYNYIASEAANWDGKDPIRRMDT